MASYRVDKVEQLIKEQISSIILHKLSNLQLGFITVTNVKVSADLKIAKIQEVDVFIPNYTEEFLEFFYGKDWRIPNPRYNAQFLDNKSLRAALDQRIKEGI